MSRKLLRSIKGTEYPYKREAAGLAKAISKLSASTIHRGSGCDSSSNLSDAEKSVVFRDEDMDYWMDLHEACNNF